MKVNQSKSKHIKIMTKRTNYHTYEGEQFRFEVILDDLDDMYHPYTLLLSANRTNNMISGETFYNEIERLDVRQNYS